MNKEQFSELIAVLTNIAEGLNPPITGSNWGASGDVPSAIDSLARSIEGIEQALIEIVKSIDRQ